MDISEIDTITVEAVAALKQSRISTRTSLFPVNATDTYPENTVEVVDYSPNYKSKLLEESYKWREAYDTLKDEYLKLKNKNVVVIEPDCLEEHENYIAKARHVNDLVQYMSSMHDHMIEMRKKREDKLKSIVCENNNIMHDRLKL